MELPDHGSLKSEKLQFVSLVMDLSLGHIPAGIGDEGISPIIMGLVEDSPQARPTSVSMQLERLSKVGIGQNRQCGTQTLHFIKGLLASVIQVMAALFLHVFLPVVNSCRGRAICMNLEINW